MRINFLKLSGFSAIFSILLLSSCATINTSKPKLADDFVRLSAIDPSIIQDMRYSTTNNFTGAVVDGYKRGECILKKPAAIALKKVQAEAKKQGYSLIIYDCFRPQKAVDNFVRWVKGGSETNPEYYADIPRNLLIEKGYIADKSNHSRGFTADLGLAPLVPNGDMTRQYYACNSRPDLKSLDFGTPFDCFNTAANTFNPIVTGNAAKNRKILVDLMAAQGYANYSEEWWHFTHSSQPKDAPRYNFDVE